MKTELKYLLVALLLTATSCSNDDATDAVNGAQIELTASIDDSSRAANNLQNTFTTDDEFGVFIMTNKGGVTTNMAENKSFKIKADGTLSASDGTRYFYPTNNYTTTIYAYKPYSTQSISGRTFNTATDQTSATGYIASDVLWGTPKNGNPLTASAQPVELNFVHRCAKLVVELTVTDELDLQGYTMCTSEVITGMKLSDIATGSFAATTDKGEITFGNLTSATTQTHAVLLVPQSIASGTNFVRIVPGNTAIKPLVLKLTSALKLESGKVHTLRIIARRNSLEFDGIDITQWQGNHEATGSIEEEPILFLDKQTADCTLARDVTLTGTSSYKITIADGLSVTLKDVTINNQIVCSGNATITLKGTNKVSYQNYAACIKIGPEGTTLTINGTDDDILEVRGPCGIGNGSYDIYNSGNIVINGGKITAEGYPAIGSYNREIGNITINDGIIYAECPGWDSAGIGSRTGAKCGDINILGGDVTAIGGKRGSAVGNGFQGGSSTNSIVIKNCRRFYAVSEDGGTCVGSGQQSNNFASITIENCPEVIFEKRTGGSYMKATPTPTVTNSKIYDRNKDTGELTDITDKFTN